MTIQGKTGSIGYGAGRARGEGSWPAVMAAVLKPDQGELPAGLILSPSAEGLVPYAAVAAEVVGTGDGAEKGFAATLAAAPIRPGSLAVTDGTETFSDDGLGRLTGSAGGSGTVVYTTGALSVTLNAAPAEGTDVTADYEREPKAVLDEPVDTEYSGSGLVVRVGPVQGALLKVGAVAQEAPSEELLGHLIDRHIIPV